jgi:hypothetical protein
MGLTYRDTEPAPLPGRAALQFARTVRAPLAVVPPQRYPGPITQPMVHDSGSAPLGDEAAYVPKPCLGWCERQGRSACKRECPARTGLSRTEVIDSNIMGLDVAEHQAKRMAGPTQAANWFVGFLLALLAAVASVHWGPGLWRWLVGA